MYASLRVPFCCIILITTYAVDSYAIFWASDIKLEEKIAFQIYLSPPDHIDLSRLPITSVGFSFAQDCGTIRIECDNNADEKERLSDDGVQLLDVGSVLLPETKEHSVRSYINWGAGQSIVIYGTVQANTATELKVGSFQYLWLQYSNKFDLLDWQV